MKHEKNFRLEMINWIDGEIKKVEREFDSLKEAKDHIEEELLEGSIKIYNKHGEVEHSENRERKYLKHHHEHYA